MGAEDLNSDGLADVVIPSTVPGPAYVAWLLRADNISTVEPSAWQLDATPLVQGTDRVILADLDADGAQEIVAASKDANSVVTLRAAAFRGSVATYGDASFTSEVQPYQPNFIAKGDFNGDGFADAVHSSGGPVPLSGFPTTGMRIVSSDVTLDLPTKTFTTFFEDTNNPDGIGVGRINGDGFDDLIVAQAGVLSFRVSDGAGGFIEVDTSPTDLQGVDRVRQLIVVDIDHDGDRDIIVPMAPPELHLQQTNGTFADPSLSGTNPGAPASAMGDFNGDGYWDVALGGTALNIMEGDGTGSLSFSQSYALGSTVNGLVAVDVTGDGAVDLVATRVNGSALHYLIGITDRGLPTGQFLDPIQIQGSVSTTDIRVFDPDRDGLPDFVVSDNGSSVMGLAFTGNDAVRNAHVRPLTVVTSLSSGDTPPLLFAPAEYVPSDPDRFGALPQLSLTGHIARLMPQGEIPAPWAALEEESLENPAHSPRDATAIDGTLVLHRRQAREAPPPRADSAWRSSTDQTLEMEEPE